MIRHRIGKPRKIPRSSIQEEGILSRLTTRQKEVLSLMVAGKSNQEIADALCVALGTVKAHIVRLFKLLNVNTRTQASVLWAEALAKADRDAESAGDSSQ